MRCARCGSHNPFNRLLGGAIRPVLGGCARCGYHNAFNRLLGELMGGVMRC